MILHLSNLLDIIIGWLGIGNKYTLVKLGKCCRLYYLLVKWDILRANTGKSQKWRRNIAFDQGFLAELVENVRKQEISLAGGVNKLEFLYDSLIRSFRYIDEIVRISPHSKTNSSQDWIPFISNPLPHWNEVNRYQITYVNQYKGWGLMTMRFIPKHTSLMIYAGELISTKEMKRRYVSRYDSQVLVLLT